MSTEPAPMSPSHDAWYELVVGRVLDALEPVEDARLSAHLPTCPDCRDLEAEMAAVAASLAYAGQDLEPPAALLEGIRAALPAVESRVPAAVGGGRLVLMADRSARRGARRRRPSQRFLTVAAALSAAAALVVVGTFAVQARSDRDRATTKLASEATVIRDLQDGNSYSVLLSSNGTATGAAVVDGRSVDLVTNGLDANNTRTSEYVLWVSIAPGRMQAIKGFDVSGTGPQVVHAMLPAAATAPTVFGVTQEAGRTLPSTPGRAVLGVSTSS
jgi:hypothetical protein